jgi:hypothetical protein
MGSRRVRGAAAAALALFFAGCAADEDVPATLGWTQAERLKEVVTASPEGRAGAVPELPPSARGSVLPIQIGESVFVSDPYDGPPRFATRGWGAAILVTHEGLELLGAPGGREDPPAETLVVHYEGANPRAALEGLEPLETRVSYFVGKDPSGWHTDVPVYASVAHPEVYPGIGVFYRGQADGRLKREFRVAPRSDPVQIRMRYRGAHGLRLEDDGTLAVETDRGTLRESPPVAYQEARGERVPVQIAWALAEEGVVGFRIGDFDRARELVIDPSLTFSTYLGSSGRETGEGIAYGKPGWVYVTGDAHMSFPYGVGGFKQSLSGKSGTYVAKLDSGGTKLVYVALISGNHSVSEPAAIAVDPAGNAYVTGYTNVLSPTKADFPIKNAYQTTFKGNFDSFLLKLNAAGNGIVFSTYLGGTNQDFGYDVAVDAKGNAWVVGSTLSTDYPNTSASYQKKIAGACDAFATRFDSSGSLLYSTYLGGSSGDKAFGAAIGPKGHLHLTGWTSSTNFPTVGPLQPPGGAMDAFVTRLEVGETTTSLGYSTHLGGAYGDYGETIGVDGKGNAYVAGGTSSSDFPKQNPISNKFGGGKCPSGWKGACPLSQDAFVSSLDPQGKSLVYSTLLGGNGYEVARDLAVNEAGYAYVTGWTASAKFPLKDAVQATPGGQTDVFVHTFKPNGALAFGTLLGGSDYEYGLGVTFDGLGHVFGTGTTHSDDFPVKNALDKDFNHKPPYFFYGDADAFVAKLQVYLLQVKLDPDDGVLDWLKSWWHKFGSLFKKK